MIKINENKGTKQLLLEDIRRYLTSREYKEEVLSKYTSYTKGYYVGGRVNKKVFMGIHVDRVLLAHVITLFPLRDTFEVAAFLSVLSSKHDPEMVKKVESSKEYNDLIHNGLRLVGYTEIRKDLVKITFTAGLPLERSGVSRYIYQTVEKDIPKAIKYFHNILKPALRKGRM